MDRRLFQHHRRHHPAIEEVVAPLLEETMSLHLGSIGQIALPVSDVDRAEAFYESSLGLRKLYRFGDLTFFDCAGVRLLLDKVHGGGEVTPRGCIYFRCADIALAVKQLVSRGVSFTSKPELIAKMDDHD